MSINLSRKSWQDTGIRLPRKAVVEHNSFFAVGLHKAGSTLLTEMLRWLAPGFGYVPFDLHQQLDKKGLHLTDVEIRENDVFEQKGFAYVGFRGWPNCHVMPNWAKGRVLFLVRDPRDVLVSMYYSMKTSHVAPNLESPSNPMFETSFNALRLQAQSTGVDEFAAEYAPAVLKEYTETFETIAGSRPKIWRYEDVIFTKLQWVKEMLQHLGMAYPPDEVFQTLLEKFDVQPNQEDPSQHIRKVTPGDHREKLSAVTIKELDRVFQQVLKQYNYV